MLRPLLLLVFYFLAHSCGMLIDGDVSNGATRKHDSTNPVFLAYVASFEQSASTLLQDPGFNIGDIPINFGDTKKDSYAGLCVRYNNGQREIFIKESWWNVAPKMEKEALLYHELGHCRLNRAHDGQEIDSHKSSLMNAVVPSAQEYTQYRSEYLIELFKNDKRPFIDALQI